MSHRATGALIFALVTACQASPSPGASCAANSDCTSPLACRLGRCRSECTANRDCPTPQRCLLDANHFGACSLEVDERCMSGGHVCPAGLICVGDQCANTCTTDADCPSDGVCRDAATTGQRFCFAPDRQDAGPPTDADHVDSGHDAAQSTDDGGRDAGMDAGNDAGMDAFVDVDGGSDAGTDGGSDAASIDTGPIDGGTCVGSACGTVLDMCATVAATCVIRSPDRQVLCWGDYRTLGDTFDATPVPHTCDGTTGNCSVSPVRVRVMGTGAYLQADQIACASETVCARDGANVYCWGNNANGELGHTGGVQSAAVLVSGLGTPQGLHAGYANFCTHDGSGALTCWGRTAHGELGTVSATPLAPTPLGGYPNYAANISLGAEHSCTAPDTAVLCRGDNALSQLGTMGGTGSASPITAGTFPTGVNSIHATAFGTCILNGTTARCWGTGSCGELGIGSTSPQPMPTAVAGGGSYRIMWSSPMSGVVCAQTVTTDLVDCWGSLYPATGGCSATPTTPTRHVELDHARAMALGRQHWCYADMSGVVYCAGNNWAGQLARYPAMDADDPTFRQVCISSACVP